MVVILLRTVVLVLNRDDNDGGIDYPIHVGTSTSNGNGAHLTSDGLWTNASSRTFKTAFKSLDGQEMLDRINSLSVESWQYKGTQGRHIGPVAEDFSNIFKIGNISEDGTNDDKYLASSDVAGVALLGVQELTKLIQDLAQKNTELERRISELEAK